MRVSTLDKRLFKRAGRHYAQRKGTGTYSDWVRMILTEAAKKELGEDES